MSKSNDVVVLTAGLGGEEEELVHQSIWKMRRAIGAMPHHLMQQQMEGVRGLKVALGMSVEECDVLYKKVTGNHRATTVQPPCNTMHHL